MMSDVEARSRAESYNDEIIENASQHQQNLHNNRKLPAPSESEYKDCSVITANPGPKLLIPPPAAALPAVKEEVAHQQIDWKGSHSSRIKWAALISTVLLLCFSTTIFVLLKSNDSSSSSQAQVTTITWKNYSIGVLTDSAYNTSTSAIQDSFVSILAISASSSNYTGVQVEAGTFSSSTITTSSATVTYDSFVASITANNKYPPYSATLRTTAKTGDPRLTFIRIMQITDIDEGESIQVCYDGTVACSDPDHISTPSPTVAPTASPTESPTMVPTAAPTASPTPAPTSHKCSFWFWC
jgi:hypothetical protein